MNRPKQEPELVILSVYKFSTCLYVSIEYKLLLHVALHEDIVKGRVQNSFYLSHSFGGFFPLKIIQFKKKKKDVCLLAIAQMHSRGSG